MIDICILGTSGMSPLVNRHLSSAIVRCDGAAFLLDCGEGTQLALREAGIQLISHIIKCREDRPFNYNRAKGISANS